MENVADALQMAAFVLIFVLALSISINAFGEARQTSQIILDYRDREYDYTFIEESDPNKTKRIVGAETIVPSIYKAYQENYKIVFRKKNEDKGIELYQKYPTSTSTTPESICFIDLEKEVLGTDEQKEKFIQYLLYGYQNDNDVKIFKDAGLNLSKNGIYEEIIKNQQFEESLGVYYQEELKETVDENAPEANKTKKRVITYTKTN